ncbi:MAG: BadF/BadG/BcrA/BcrD ATPase family protein [Ferroplasma sp.]|uniref:BadF/BadG/BcrA/BcrD ATPase family protein n=1 Tax=Ferroplasma sp. TaxID=2591003 RepID=UPI0028165B1A|nr:BadF/BadG/BcrA/BcrD ATPase family protein [Ferroplasma sp.]WMT50556.1 MAG: BadF/BadG/BcrA/BcrD ATPase family protein [Ferroplasma sp.]
MADKRYILAVDGGATKTASIAYDLVSEKVVGSGISGPSNLTSAGVKIASDNIKKACMGSLEMAEVGFEDIYGGIFGIAGVGDSISLTETGRNIVRNITGRDDFTVLNDGVGAYYLANLGEDGIVFAGGTGSVLFYQKNNELKRKGGWNWFIGDDGSASWMAKSGLNIGTMEYDKIYPDGVLMRSAEEYFNMEFHELIPHLEQNQNKALIAGFSRRVSSIAESGYANAINILHTSATYVSNAIKSAQMEIGSKNISLVGGTYMAGDVYISMIEKQLLTKPKVFFGYQVAVGSLLYLMNQNGIKISSNIRDRILRQFEDTGVREKYIKILDSF